MKATSVYGRSHCLLPLLATNEVEKLAGFCVAVTRGAIQKNGRQATKAIHQISVYPTGKFVYSP